MQTETSPTTAAKPASAEGASSSANRAGHVASEVELGDLVLLGLSGRVELEVLRQKRKDVMVARLRRCDGQSVVMKLFARSGWAAMVRRFTGTSAMQREWAALGRLWERGVNVPRPMALLKLPPMARPYTDALFTEDLGCCTGVAYRMKELHQEKRIAELEQLEDEVIALTKAMVEARVLDSDHGLKNIVYTPAGQVVRMDLEMAQQISNPARRPKVYAAMLGRLVSSYVMTLQPDVSMAYSFARRLREALGTPPNVLVRTQTHVMSQMHRQAKLTGVQTSLGPLWEGL